MNRSDLMEFLNENEQIKLRDYKLLVYGRNEDKVEVGDNIMYMSGINYVLYNGARIDDKSDMPILDVIEWQTHIKHRIDIRKLCFILLQKIS